MGRRVHRVPLDAAYAHDLDAMDRRLTSKVGLVFVCNPNNPTGTLVGDTTLRDYVTSTAKRTMVLVDEAYHDYVTEPGYRSMKDLVERGENVIVLRTASKIHGLAGCRIGFAIARPDVIARMQGFTTGVPNALAARAAIAALADTAWQQMCVQKNGEGREILRAAIEQTGRRQVASHTNFVFFEAGRPANDVRMALEGKGFLVGRAFPPYSTWARVSVGTPEEMHAFARVLPGALQT
jgi:histidinol-phosphate aminotransferase